MMSSHILFAKLGDLRTKFVEIHPDDSTRYEFLIADYNEENLWIGGSLMTGYLFRKQSILNAAPLVRDRKRFENDLMEGRVDPYVGYIASHNERNAVEGSKYWTGRALVLAATKVLEEWEDESDEDIERRR